MFNMCNCKLAQCDAWCRFSALSEKDSRTKYSGDTRRATHRITHRTYPPVRETLSKLHFENDTRNKLISIQLLICDTPKRNEILF